MPILLLRCMLLWGYLGVMAKFGPFCRSDNCSRMRGVLDKLITHLLVQSIHVCSWLDCWSPGVGWGAGAGAGRRCGAVGVAGTVECLEDAVEVLGKLDGTFGCLLKVFSQSMLSTFVVCLVRLSKCPYHSKNRCSNLLMCFPFILLCLCSLILLINNLLLSKSRSASGDGSWP